MLEPCSSGSYITESAAEELQLKGERQNLTILGTGGTEIKKQSRRVECSVSSMNGLLSATVEVNVLDNITGNTPAIDWSTSIVKRVVTIHIQCMQVIYLANFSQAHAFTIAYNMLYIYHVERTSDCVISQN